MYRMHLTPAATHKKNISWGGMSETENENDDRSAPSDSMPLAWAENGEKDEAEENWSNYQSQAR